MGEDDLWVKGGQTHTHTQLQINTMTRPDQRAEPSEKKLFLSTICE